MSILFLDPSSRFPIALYQKYIDNTQTEDPPQKLILLWEESFTLENIGKITNYIYDNFGCLQN